MFGDPPLDLPSSSPFRQLFPHCTFPVKMSYTSARYVSDGTTHKLNCKVQITNSNAATRSVVYYWTNVKFPTFRSNLWLWYHKITTLIYNIQNKTATKFQWAALISITYFNPQSFKQYKSSNIWHMYEITRGCLLSNCSHFTSDLPIEGWPGWVDLDISFHIETCMQMVTGSSTNRGRRRATLTIDSIKPMQPPQLTHVQSTNITQITVLN